MVFKIKAEDLEKYAAEAFYEAAVELNQTGKKEEAENYLLLAYSYYIFVEDVEGIKKCKNLSVFNDGLDSIAFDTKEFYESQRGKIIGFPDYVKTPKDIIDCLKKHWVKISK